eukprot:g4266.t1
MCKATFEAEREGKVVPASKLRQLLAVGAEPMDTNLLELFGQADWEAFHRAVQQLCYADNAMSLLLRLAGGTGGSAVIAASFRAFAAATELEPEQEKEKEKNEDGSAGSSIAALSASASAVDEKAASEADADGTGDADIDGAASGDPSSGGGSRDPFSSFSAIEFGDTGRGRRQFSAAARPIEMLVRRKCLRQDLVDVMEVSAFRGLPRVARPSVLLTPSLTFGLGLSSQACFGGGFWNLLYRSTDHGLSFDLLCHRLIGYEGPTLIVIKDTEGHVFGAFCHNDKG